MTAEEFRNKYLGKAIDVDGAAGVQCVDLFKQCCYLAGKGAFALGGSGYADEIVHRFNALGLGTYFDLVQLANAQYGDWLVWDKGSKECADSHVAMFERWEGSKVFVLGQNQFGQRKATEGSISTSGIIGVLRLKAWKRVEQAPTAKYGVGTPVCTGHIWASSTDTGAGYTGDWKGKITRVIPGARHPYLLNDGNIGWTDDASIDADPHDPLASGGQAVPAPNTDTVTLPASATSWRVYPTNVAPVVGNECGKLFPSKFGGLTYDIIGRPQIDVVTIKTRDYGTVNIYVAPSTGAIIK